MRRFVVGGVALVLSLALGTPAEAGFSGTVHNDRDDTGSVLDIRQVATGSVSRRKEFFGVETWDFFSASDLSVQDSSYFQFNLDTFGRGATDRYLYLYYYQPDDRFYCELDPRIGRQLALKVATQSWTQVYCAVPKRALGINKTPKYAVEAWSNNSFVDRAPNVGRYRGL